MDDLSFYKKSNLALTSDDSYNMSVGIDGKNEMLENGKIKNKQINPTKIKDKKIILTSALPYANGEIHLGHIASTYLPADNLTRFIKLTGSQIYHICATDDFGTPILIKSEKEGKTPEEYVQIWNEKDKKDFESIGIIFDFFYKTSSVENIKFVQYVFLKLYDNNHIVEKPIVQFFSFSMIISTCLIGMLLENAHFAMLIINTQICVNLVEGFQKKY